MNRRPQAQFETFTALRVPVLWYDHDQGFLEANAEAAADMGRVAFEESLWDYARAAVAKAEGHPEMAEPDSKGG